jgi:hypothetical protein
VLSMAMPSRTRATRPVAEADPPSRAACWIRFVIWSAGVPLVAVAGLAVIAGGLWLFGGQGLTNQAMQAMGDALFWIAAIALMYPAMLVIWVLELRDGLRTAGAWERMDAAERASMAAARDMPVARPGQTKGKRR